MKNYPAYILSIATLIAVGIGFTSCKEDEPPAKPKLAFAQPTMTVSENDGVIEVELVLDKAYGKDLNVEYDVGGTASDQDAVGSANADFEVVGDHGVVVIESGQTSAVIQLEIYNDAGFEEDETIELSVMDVNTSDVEVTTDDEIEITISNDDIALQLSFAAQTLTVDEAGDSVLVELLLDKPAPQDIVIGYTLSGTATDSLTAFTAKTNPDYYIDGKAGEVTFRAGETKAFIEVELYSDLIIEDGVPATDPFDPETIVITVSNPNGIQMSDNTMEISLAQEDGLIVLLAWPAQKDTLKADMDIILRVGQTTSSWYGILTGAATESYQSPEFIFLPNAINYPAYGLSYVYYDGTFDTLDFEVVFIDLINSALEPEANALTYEARYTKVNKNKWNDASTTVVVQTFEKSGDAFTTPSQIQVPTSGSRTRSGDRFNAAMRRSQIGPAKLYDVLKNYR
ncbi:MAG: Calx-beta domain-containing protein [Chryseosolibacter sp.]